MDATWKPQSSSSNRLPRPWKTSHIQPPNYLQGAPSTLLSPPQQSLTAQLKKIHSGRKSRKENLMGGVYKR